MKKRHTSSVSGTAVESQVPIVCDVNQTAQIIQASRSRVYQLIAAGRLDARKAGRKTLIIGQSIQQYLTDLPCALVG